MKQIKLNVLIIAGMMALFSSCQKYADGGLKGKAEKRIQNSWTLDTYLRNGTDETSLMLISQYVETYTESGQYSRSYRDDDGDLFSEQGDYRFTSEQDLDISGVSSIEDFSNNNSTLSSSTYLILRLKKDEYWYSFENGGDTHEFRFIKQ